MCHFISGYRLPDGSLRFHTDADVEAAYEKSGKTNPINWQDYVGHSGYRFCFGNPPGDSTEIEGLRYCLNKDLRLFRKLMLASGYKSLTQRDAKSVAEGNKLYVEGNKLRAEGDRLYAEGGKLYAKGRKLYAESGKLRAEGGKLWTESGKLYVEGDRLRAEGYKLYVEGNKLYVEGDRLRAEGDRLCFDIGRQ